MDQLERVDWTEAMAVGIAVLDREHQSLVDHINRLADAAGQGGDHAVLGETLEALAAFAEVHFEREERLMDVAGYPGFAEHRRRHRHFIDRLGNLRVRFAGGRDQTVLADTHDLLLTYLREHVEIHDREIVAAARGNDAAIRACEAVPPMLPHRDQPADRGADGGQPFQWSRVRVLIVDDDADFRFVLRTILTTIGVGRAVEVADGAGALDAVVTEDPFDLVITDHRMRGMTGLELIHALRAQDNPAAIALVTGQADPELAEAAVAAGVDAIVEKPISARGLIAVLARALAHRAGHAAVT